jgi:ATP synthase protein I
MLAKYAIIVRRAGALTAIAAAIMVAASAALVGVKGLYGSLLGVALVIVFFGISVLVVGRAAKISPQAMMVAALVSYLVKFIALAIVLSMLHGVTALSGRALGFTALVCILVWSAAQTITAIKVKMLYVEPEEPAKPASPARPARPTGQAEPAGSEGSAQSTSASKTAGRMT